MDSDGRMFVAQKIDDLLTARSPDGFCDECLALSLGIADTRQVTLRTERLADMPYFRRQKESCSGCGNDEMVISVAPRIVRAEGQLVPRAAQ